jgi:hypothetical protein
MSELVFGCTKRSSSFAVAIAIASNFVLEKD